METASLASLCSRISSGGTPSRKHPEYFADEGGHLWVKSQELVDRPISDTSEKISDLGLAKSSAKYYDEDTVLIAMYGATVGQLAILKAPATVNQAVCALCVDPEIADYRYVFYALMATRHDLTIQAAGAAQQNLNQGLIRDFEIPLYPLDKQRWIASVLGSLDDLIENNRRRIEILEGMARLIYREWFVYFRFPGHEDGELVDSDLGPIPEGWEIAAVDDVAELVRGRSYRRADVVEEPDGQPFLNLKCIDRGGGFRKSGLKRYDGPFKQEQLALPGDTVIAVTDMTQERNIVAQAGRVPSLPEGSGVISLDLVRVVPRQEMIDADYLYGMFRYSTFSGEVKEHANGTNVLHLSPDRIREYRFAVAPVETQRTFRGLVRPMYDLVGNLQVQSEVLAEARDLLLPRLISDELDVSDLDLDLEPVA